MNNKTLKITYGAMLIAVFGVIMLINRQIGGLMDGVLLFVLPIPMVAYAVKYGGKSSVAVFVCMAALAFFLGTFTTIFVGVSAALIGMVYGTCLYHKKNMTKTLLLIMALSVVVELVNIVIIAGIAGIGLDQSITELQTMMNQVMSQMEATGMAMDETSKQTMDLMMETDHLRRMAMVVVAFSGALEGFIIYGLSLVVLKKLRISVPKLTPVSEFYPPRWSGFVAFAAYFLYSYSMGNPFSVELANHAAQIVGMCGMLYLLVFGVIAGMGLIQKYVTKNKAAVIILPLLGVLFLPLFVIVLSVLYISGTLHDQLNDRI